MSQYILPRSMTAPQLAAPDNAADITVTIAVSGNRLVAVLNALDQMAHETGRYQFAEIGLVANGEWYAGLRSTTEAIRDELSRQRCEARP